MKTFVFVLCTLISSLLINAQETQGATITVTIDNIVNDEGKVIIALHSSETFMRGEGIMSQESTITDGKVEFTFEGVPAGTYAIMALHDANSNNRMDYEANGMPKESYGMSGNEMTMGPPNFEMAKFNVTNEDLEFNIRF
ncbi:DUF2141 domain-containing protein [Muricauda sp. SCSIO 64092]|uniref:DUF2141 domain-containing protein n=1 Tax=Allomuricauda sp. SCSIO 64092 TaxID=2908842 RepID=UPI001FF5D692|nr:DUF2141 domain-containing protein [Muricauda sp. SCSIO 64092]UOY07126.1 DUF2141 domain-containing protein [Muricauda sp. SCSIO 64092]